MVSKYQKLFNLSPIWFQNWLISLHGKKLYRQRYGKVYFKAREEYVNRDYSVLKDELKIQNSELKSLLLHAVGKSPFYKEHFAEIDISTISTVNDLKKLPILEKEIFRKRIDDIYTIPESDAIVSFTGGTTGKAIKVLFRKDDFQKRMAYLDAFKMRIGIEPFNARKATFSGRQFIRQGEKKVFWRENTAYNQRLYSTFDLTDTNLALYIRNLNEYKPLVINGFVSAISDVAKYIKDHELKLSFTPKAIFTTSETLLPHHRNLIQEVFGCHVFNQYASAEGAPFITECTEGNLHYNLDTGVIEILPTQHGDEMLVTSFTTRGTPLIRYRIGDKIEFSNKGACKCGSVHPMVTAIEGRQVEYLISKERGKVSLSHLADVIKGLPSNLKKMQFIQEDSETIRIKLVVDSLTFNDSDEHSITNEMTYRFGNKMNFVFDYVDDIPREKSGKYALIKNKII